MSLFEISSVLLLLVSLSAQTIVDKCTNGAPLPTVTLSSNGNPCEIPPCAVYPGYAADIELHFKSIGYSEKLVPSVLAKALGATIKWPLDQNDACVGITNTYCPLVKDEPVSYRYAMQLKAWFPQILANLEFSLVNENGEVVACFNTNIQVTEA